MKRLLSALLAVGVLWHGVPVVASGASPETLPSASSDDELARLNAAPGSEDLLRQTGGGPSGADSLTSAERLVLRVIESSAPGLLDQVASGCRQVWNNETQKSETKCYNPLGVMMLFGMAGGLLGGLLTFNPAIGAAGAVGGAAFGALLITVGGYW